MKIFSSITFVVFLLILSGCTKTQPINDNNDNNDDDNHNDTTVVEQNDGFIVVGRILGDFVQSHYFDIDNDILIPFGSLTSRDGVWNANRDSVYFNYGGLGEGIWTAPIDSETPEPTLIYDSPYPENEILKIPSGFIFKITDSPTTLMFWDGENLDTAFVGTFGMCSKLRISPDSSLFAFYQYGIEQRIYIIEIADTTPWDTLCTLPGRTYSWLDYDPDKIFTASDDGGIIYTIRGERDSTSVSLPQSGYSDVAAKDFEIFGLFGVGDSTEIWILPANLYIQRKICSIYGTPKAFDVSPFDNIIAVAVNQGDFEYIYKVNIDNGSTENILIANFITGIRWK